MELSLRSKGKEPVSRLALPGRQLFNGTCCGCLLSSVVGSKMHRGTLFSPLWRNGKQHCKKRQKCSGNWAVNLVHPFVGATGFIFVSDLLFVLFAVFRLASMYDGTASFVLGDLMSSHSRSEFCNGNANLLIPENLRFLSPYCPMSSVTLSCQ